MAVFQYTAIENGAKSQNMLFAPDEEQALQELRRRKVVILELSEVGLGSLRMRPRNLIERKLTGLVTTKVKQEQMMRQWVAMLKAGVPIPQMLEVASSVAPTLLGRALWEASQLVNAGKSFSSAVYDKLTFLPPSVKGLIEIGERSGQLVSSLESSIVIVRRNRQLLMQILQSLLYPAIILILLLGVSYYGCMYALPKIMGSISGLASNVQNYLPWSFKMIQAIYIFVSEEFPYILFTIAGLAAACAYACRSPYVKRYFDLVIMEIPFIGKVAREYCNGMWCRTLGTMLKNNIEISFALKLTIDSMSNQYYKKNLVRLRQLIEQGQSFSDSLRVTALSRFCPMAVAMGRVGQMTDNLSENLLITAEYSEEEMLARLAICMELIQPFMIIVLSVLIFLVLYAIYGAIWAIYNSYLPS